MRNREEHSRRCSSGNLLQGLQMERGMMRSRLIVVAATFWLFQIGVSAQETLSASAARIELKTAANLSSPNTQLAA
jgi:hypothetical protein